MYKRVVVILDDGSYEHIWCIKVTGDKLLKHWYMELHGANFVDVEEILILEIMEIGNKCLRFTGMDIVLAMVDW